MKPPLLEVSGLSHDGRGVARRDGKTVFIAGALPGEQVRCRVTRARARFDEAQLLEVLRASPQRRAPPCPHFGHCGGCTLQHLSDGAQLAAHQQQLAGALERIAGLQPGQWLEPVASDPFGYRARARLAVAWDAGARRVALGFRRGASRVVEPLDSCPVLAPAAGALIAPLAALIATLAAPGQVHELWLATGEPGLALGVACAPALDAPLATPSASPGSMPPTAPGWRPSLPRRARCCTSVSSPRTARSRNGLRPARRCVTPLLWTGRCWSSSPGISRRPTEA